MTISNTASNLQTEELMALSVDPVIFMEEAFNISPDPWQEALLYRQPDRTLMLCSRQSGKSTISAAIALHTAIFSAGSLILVVASTLKQAQELFIKIKAGLDFAVSATFVHPIYETQMMLQFSNGSRIISAPGQKYSIRGYSNVAYLIVDEAALVEDEFYFAIRPMLAVSRGKIIAMSTPYGRRGWFYEAWEEKANLWNKIRMTALDCPRITKEFLDEEKKALPEWFYLQEYFCEFVDTDSQFFGYDMILDSIDDDIKEWEI